MNLLNVDNLHASYGDRFYVQPEMKELVEALRRATP